MLASLQNKKIAFLCLAIVAAVLFLAQVAMSWTGPTASPPDNNVDAPINVGSTDQAKDAALGVEGLAVFGNTLLEGSAYLNWGSTAGSTGYGLRDNAGSIEYKNSGGNWTSLSAPLGWVVSGNNIYNSNSANVGIGNSNPQQKLDVTGIIRQVQSSSYDVWIQGGASSAGNDDRNLALLGEDEDSGDRLILNHGAEYAAGTIVMSNLSATSFLYSSDKRLKENIAELKDGLKKVLALVPVSFTWKEGGTRPGEHDIGFIAQDVEKVVPEVVVTGIYDGYKSVDYPRLVPVLVQAIQEQQAQIDELKAEVDALKAAQ
jgi:hypothetical protein